LIKEGGAKCSYLALEVDSGSTNSFLSILWGYLKKLVSNKKKELVSNGPYGSSTYLTNNPLVISPPKDKDDEAGETSQVASKI
jgi:hypothetical protein